jgi:hypothetical protein
VDGFGSFGLGLDAIETSVSESMGGIAHGLHTASQSGSDLGKALALSALQQDLAAAECEGIGRAETLTKGVPSLVVKGRTNRGSFIPHITHLRTAARADFCDCIRQAPERLAAIPRYREIIPAE